MMYESYHIHWPHRGDWASTAAGTRASANARVYMIVAPSKAARRSGQVVDDKIDNLK